MTGIGSAAWLEGLLREQLGPDAVLGEITFEDRLVYLKGASVPLGAGVAIRIEQAIVELGAGLPLGVLPLSARLLTLQGEVRGLGRPLSLMFLTRGEEARWVQGTLRLGAPLNLSAAVDLDGHRLRYRDLAGAARGARFSGWGRFPFPFATPSRDDAAAPLVTFKVEGVRAALLADLASLAGVTLPLEGPEVSGLPSDLAVAGEGMILRDRAVSGSFAVETPRSVMRLQVALGAGGQLLGSTLRGRAGAADAVALGLFLGPIRPRAETLFDVDARLSGTLAEPGLSGRLTAARASLDVGDALVLALDELSTRFDLDADRLVWHGLAGRFHGGAVTSSGRVDLGRGGEAIRADLAWTGVRVEDLPTGAAGERALVERLRGVSSGELRFEHGGLAGQALTARGKVSVAQPVYLFTRALAPELARYGLPPIRAQGKGPLAAAVRLDRGEILVEPLVAAVDGIDLDGALRIGLDGRLRGRVRVHLRESYLAGSPILALPAVVTGRVTIPIDLGGSVSAPELRTDALEILDGLLAPRRAVGAVKGALDGLWNAARRR